MDDNDGAEWTIILIVAMSVDSEDKTFSCSIPYDFCIYTVQDGFFFTYKMFVCIAVICARIYRDVYNDNQEGK